MRLRIVDLGFLPDGNGLKCCFGKTTTALARIVPDETCPTMWRVVRSDGLLSDLVSKTRAKDAARGMAEASLYISGRIRAA